jgi:hypothetical protein
MILFIVYIMMYTDGMLTLQLFWPLPVPYLSRAVVLAWVCTQCLPITGGTGCSET